MLEVNPEVKNLDVACISHFHKYFMEAVVSVIARFECHGDTCMFSATTCNNVRQGLQNIYRLDAIKRIYGYKRIQAIRNTISDSLMVSKTSLLHVISDERTSNILKSIALAHMKGHILISRLKLTRRQYYSSIFSLKQAGLVKRENGVYLLTIFGRVFYNVVTDLETKLENALSNYWKLKAIDAMQLSSIEATKEVICALIDDQEIRSLLLNEAQFSKPPKVQALD